MIDSAVLYQSIVKTLGLFTMVVLIVAASSTSTSGASAISTAVPPTPASMAATTQDPIGSTGAALELTPSNGTCVTLLEVVRLKGTNFEPGTETTIFVYSGGDVGSALPGRPVAPDGTVTIDMDFRDWIGRCEGPDQDKDGTQYFIELTTGTPQDGIREPSARAVFTFQLTAGSTEATLVLTPSEGTCDSLPPVVRLDGTNFIPGTKTSILVGGKPGTHFFEYPGKPVAADGTVTIDFDFRRFIVACDGYPTVGDGYRYSVELVTGQPNDYREPKAGAAFTFHLTASDRFNAIWARQDRPIVNGIANRTWTWGPQSITQVLAEEYAESPGHQREVQYFDKSRMEITQPLAERLNLWYVTNGLLVVEMVTGQLQTGDHTFEQRAPAVVNIAGDLDDSRSPTYASLNAAVDEPPRPEGSVIIERLDRNGAVAGDDSLAGHDIVATMLDEITNHTVAEPFWDFMNSNGLVWWYGEYEEQSLFNDNPIYATGRPITEAYWTTVRVAGVDTDVLLQCFERRCLTYTPQNEPGWQVESGNVGQHYYNWRYDKMGD